MLSKSEIEFLQRTKIVSKGYERYLRYSINKKLKQFEQQILPAILSDETTKAWFIEFVRRNTNTVRENTNIAEEQNKRNLNSFSENVVGLPGFEPESREPESRSLDQTSRQPHIFP